MTRTGAMDPEGYYRDTAVRARILEYCGATSTKPPSAAFVVGLEEHGENLSAGAVGSHVPPSRLPALLERGGDIARSFWDTRHLIFFLELDYLNVDRPAEPFVHPADVFLKLEPAYHAVTSAFGALGLRARPFVSGRGYHFIGKVPLTDPLVGDLAAMAPRTPSWLASHEARRPADVTASIGERQARAAEGLGLLIEFAAHQILARAAAAATIPVVLNGTIVGRGLNGREAVSIDFSHAGDPLDVRHIRTGFSAYQWHRSPPNMLGTDVAADMPALAMIPRNRHSLMTLLAAGRDLRAGLDAAHAGVAIIPNVATGVRALLGQYLSSPLAAFHAAFYAARQSAGGRPATAIPAVPPCVAASLTFPNDLLLKPEHVQHVVRDLLARGWHAAQIAALVQDRYEGDHGWGDRWQHMHAETRAEFNVRVFAGLVSTGADSLVDFNCVSAQEKDLCPRTGCQYDLRRDRDRLAISQ
jgi:hypothetical protein